MDNRWIWNVGLVGVLVACGASERDSAPHGSEIDAGMIPVATSEYVVRRETSSGPRIDADIEVNDEGAVIVLRLHGVDSAFGLSYYLELDPQILQTPVQPEYLGDATETRMVQHSNSASVALGGTRIAKALADATLADGLEIYRASITARPGESIDMAISGAYARRADGSYIAIGGESGTIVFAAAGVR